MNNWKNILKDIGYFGIGTAAVILEGGSKAVKHLVKKGAKIIADNQETVDELKQKAREAGVRIKEAVQDLNRSAEPPAEPEAPEGDVPVAETPETDAPEVVAPEVNAPVIPDAIYHTAAPAPEPEVPEEETRPEETANG